jgi:hypothetical protein
MCIPPRKGLFLRKSADRSPRRNEIRPADHIFAKSPLTALRHHDAGRVETDFAIAISNPLSETAVNVRTMIPNCTLLQPSERVRMRGTRIALSVRQLGSCQLKRTNEITRLATTAVVTRESDMDFMMWFWHTCGMIWGS